MRRRQFVDHLSRLSSQNSQINALMQMPIFSCKQSKINERISKKSLKNEGGSQKRASSMQNSRIYVKGEHQSRPCSATKANQESSKVIRRFQTSPSPIHPKMNSEGIQLSMCSSVKAHRVVHVNAVKNKSDIYDSINSQMVSDLTKKLGIREVVLKKSYHNFVGDSVPVERRVTKTCGSQNNEGQVKKLPNGKILYTSSFSVKSDLGDISSVKWGGGRNMSETQKRQQKIAMRRQINKNYRRPFVPPPKITAKSYIIYEAKQNSEESNVLASFNSKTSYEVASLTKIMTCIVAIELCSEFSVDMRAEEVVVGKMESSIGGTSAQLRSGQIYNIWQLLHGLMLPSGNDASLALAVWGGRKLLEKEEELKSESKVFFKSDCSSKIESTICSTNTIQSTKKRKKADCYQRFLAEMNSKARQLKMAKTNYANSHGLVNINNKSSAFDVAVLSQYALKNDIFRRVVSTKKFYGTIRFSLDLAKKSTKDLQSDDEEDDCLDSQEGYEEDEKEEGQERRPKNKKLTFVEPENVEQYTKSKDERKMNICWQNTHKLLQVKSKQYIGIKTGFTTMAGPCLASCVSIQGRQFIIVVLGCGRMSLRFRQTEVLRRWLFKHEGIKRKKKGAALEESQQGEAEKESDKYNTMHYLDDDREIED